MRGLKELFWSWAVVPIGKGAFAIASGAECRSYRWPSRAHARWFLPARPGSSDIAEWSSASITPIAQTRDVAIASLRDEARSRILEMLGER